jgi:hypothetical protein
MYMYIYIYLYIFIYVAFPFYVPPLHVLTQQAATSEASPKSHGLAVRPVQGTRVPSDLLFRRTKGRDFCPVFVTIFVLQN